MERRIIKNYGLRIAITNYGLWERSGHPAYSRDELRITDCNYNWAQLTSKLVAEQIIN